MKISKNLAREIVNNLKDVIKQDINLMDSSGIIIASTDKKRINSFHEAAKKCVDENKIIYINSDKEYIGSRSGINLPVEFDKKVIGVIGISGKEDVKKYGTIIKKMTEILLKEERIKENQNLKMENTRNLIEALIHDRLNKLDYFPENLDLAYKHIAYSMINKNILNSKSRDKITRYISIKNPYSNTYLSFIHNELIILFIEDDKDEIYKSISYLKDIFKNKFNIDLRLGLSRKFRTTKDTSYYYKEAKRAYRRTKFSEDEVTFFDKMGLGSLITGIDEREIYEYSYRILKNISEDKLEDYKKLMYLYGKYNGSIGKIADKLFMHKNSIQYRLNKLESLTGYDPRKLKDYITLYFAFLGLQ